MNKNPELLMSIVVAAFLFVVFVGLIYAALRLLVRSLDLNQRKDLKPTAPDEPHETSTWLLIFAVVIACLVIALLVPRVSTASPQPPRAGLLTWTLVPPGLLMLALFYWVWSRDTISSRAKRRSDGGDLDGAIEILREAIEAGKITAERANNLGILYLEKKEPEQALKMFRDAAKLGADGPIYLANQATALQDLGQFEDAAAIVDDLCQKNPQQWIFACSYARVLISLGRFDEAHSQLERAEKLPIISGHRFVIADRTRIIQECRALMAGKPTNLKPTGSEEL